MYKDNQGAILLPKNIKVGMNINNIGICRNFLRDVVEDKYIDIKYIRSK